MYENVRKLDQMMYKQLTCRYFQELGQLYSLPCDSETVDVNFKEHLMNAVQIIVALLINIITGHS